MKDFICYLLLISLEKVYLFIYFGRGREGEREGEEHQCVVASCAPQLGTWCVTQACALRPFDSQPALNPLSHTSQGSCVSLSKFRNFSFLICIMRIITAPVS